MTRVRRLNLAFAFATVLVAFMPLLAHAQVPAPLQPAHPGALPPRRANYSWDRSSADPRPENDLLRVSVRYRDVLDDPALVKKLSSGLPMVIAMRAYVYREGEASPVALATRVCRVVYDLWDDVYAVHLSEPERDLNRSVVLEGVLRYCAEAQDLPVVRRGLLTAGVPYFLGVVVEVNPVSPEMVDQMRHWLSRPTGSTGIGPTDALFGSFVQLFARQIATSDATLTFRTDDVVP
ncbi:MAG: hypothetical protein ACLP1X_17220 [Polyangiaceae bacterium]|jgi:hypothetical protein